MAASSQIARAVPCAFRTGLIFASVMLNDFFHGNILSDFRRCIFLNGYKMNFPFFAA